MATGEHTIPGSVLDGQTKVPLGFILSTTGGLLTAAVFIIGGHLKLENAEFNVRELQGQHARVTDKLHAIELRLQRMEDQLDGFEKSQDRIEKTLGTRRKRPGQ